MKLFVVATIALAAMASQANAQSCSGQFANSTVCGNLSGAQAPPRPITVGTAITANTGTSGHTIPFLDGANTFSLTQTISPPINTLSQGLLINQTGDGTVSPAGDFLFNKINILDGVNAPPVGGGASGIYGLQVQILTGGGQGTRGAVFGQVTRIAGDNGQSLGDDIGVVGEAVSSFPNGGQPTNVITASSWSATGGGRLTFTTTSPHSVAVGDSFYVVNTLPVGYNGVHVAITGTTGSTLVTAQAANPGVSTVQGQIDYRGTLFGSSFGARAKSGATNLFEVAGVEFDVGIDLGGSSKYLFGVSSSKVGKGSALVFEAAYEVAGGNDVEGWRNALLLTGLHGQPSMSTNGCVICTDGIAQGIRMGIDLSGYTISQYFLRGPGGQFLVDGVGNLSARSVATITPIAVAYGGTGDSGTAWSTFAPTITCVSGSVAGGTYPAQLGRYKTIGKTVFISIDVMAPAGSCSGGVATIAGLPVTAGSNIYMLVGRDESTGKMVQGRIATAATAITVSNYDGATSPAGAGLIMLSGVYETN